MWYRGVVRRCGWWLVAGLSVSCGDSVDAPPDEEAAPACELSPTRGSWSELPALNVARLGQTLVRLSGGDLVVMGGRSCVGGSSAEPLASVERLAPDGEAWEEVSPFPDPRRISMAVALADDALLVIGGAVAEEPSSDVFRYDGTSDEWTLVGSLPVPVQSGTAARFGERSLIVVRDFIQGLEAVAFMSDNAGVDWRSVNAPDEGGLRSLVPLPGERIAAVTTNHELLVLDAATDVWNRELFDVLDAAALDDRHLLVVSFEYAEEVPYQPSGVGQFGPFAIVYDVVTQQGERVGFTECRPTQGSVEKWNTFVVGDGHGRVFVSLGAEWRIYEHGAGWSLCGDPTVLPGSGPAVIQPDGSLVIVAKPYSNECENAGRVEAWRP